jgi:hypothetical protein
LFLAEALTSSHLKITFIHTTTTTYLDQLLNLYKTLFLIPLAKYETSCAEQHGSPALRSDAPTGARLAAFELLPIAYAQEATGNAGNIISGCEYPAVLVESGSKARGAVEVILAILPVAAIILCANGAVNSSSSKAKFANDPSVKITPRSSVSDS